MHFTLLFMLIPLLATAASPTVSGVGRVFPNLQGQNLERRDVLIPRELAGQANLIIFGFVRDHQQDIDTWIPHCDALERELQGFRFYEIPFIAGQYRLMRFWIDGGMRRGIPDRSARERTITVYGGRSAAMQQLGVSDLTKIYAFLVKPNGEILWQTEGRWSKQKDSSLRAALRAAP